MALELKRPMAQTDRHIFFIFLLLLNIDLEIKIL
ncbi:hypothetical protein cco99_06253 [Campylobacter coli Z156]|nr:hypothetical protein cco99_06253 [Campylobacter coli Z156]